MSKENWTWPQKAAASTVISRRDIEYGARLTAPFPFGMARRNRMKDEGRSWDEVQELLDACWMQETAGLKAPQRIEANHGPWTGGRSCRTNHLGSGWPRDWAWLRPLHRQVQAAAKASTPIPTWKPPGCITKLPSLASRILRRPSLCGFTPPFRLSNSPGACLHTIHSTYTHGQQV
jgi:hypothetical protein